MKRKHSLLALTMALAIAPAASAAPPDKAPPRPPNKAPASAPQVAPNDVQVLHLASSGQERDRALRLTKALEQRVLQVKALKFVNSNKSLLSLLEQAKCGQPFLAKAFDRGASLNERSGDDVDEACRAKLAVVLGEEFGPAERFFWGWVYQDAASKPVVTLNYWARGQAERKFSLPITEPIDKVADRLIQHLLYPGQVGDVRVVSAKAPRGEIYVGTELQGKLDGEPIDLTLPVGAHVFELRKGEKVIARGRAVVLAREPRQVELEPVTAEPPPPPLPVGTTIPPPSRKPSPWAWVAGGVGVAGLAGAGALFVLRQGAENDLKDGCSTNKNCPDRLQSTLDKSNLYGTLAPLSLGVGALGLGVATYLFLRPSSPSQSTAAPASVRITGGAAPLAGGGTAAFLIGSF